MPAAFVGLLSFAGVIGSGHQAAADAPPLPAHNPARSKAGAAEVVRSGPPVGATTRPASAEAAYLARLDAHLAPLLELDVPHDDVKRVREAVTAIGKGDVIRALALAAEIESKPARLLVTWSRLRAGFGDAGEYAAFLDDNPDWPERALLTRRLEEALLTGNASQATITSRFSTSKPVTGAGLAALANVHLANGDKAKAKALAAEAWREHDLSPAVEARILERFKDLLTAADHRWRLDRILLSDRRWNGERNAQAAIARRIVPLLSPAEQKKANARLAVYLRSKGAAKEIAALPAENAPDWGLVFQRVQLLRRSNRIDEAAKLLLGAPTDPAKIVDPDGWWDERRATAYEALEAGKSKLAYQIVRDAGPLSENPLKDQQFMAGWLALRYLRDPDLAEPHMRALRKAADGPLSRAKGDYWLARVLEAKGAAAEAADYYRAAAAERDTFHGQLARQHLEPGRRPIDIAPPAEPAASEVARFKAMTSAQAIVIAQRANLGRAITRPLLVNLRTRADSEGWSALTAHLARHLRDDQMSLRLAKSAIADGQQLLTYAYPVHALPDYDPLTPPPETAMLLGIARQETEFNTTIVSGAGARGILQVMPVTARHVCRDYKIKCDIPRLLTDTSYNTMIASAYIGDRMREFNGSYVLTLAGYNAGPGRARQWIKQFGDPRDPKVDVIDWIERIPFEETRSYVGKVLSNIQIYRARLGLDRPLRLEEDLGLKVGGAREAARTVGPAARERKAASGG